MAKFKIGDKAYAWEQLDHGRVQFDGTVVALFPKETLSKTQEEALVVIEEKTQFATRFHIYEEPQTHKEAGVTFATDPYNQDRFEATQRWAMKSSVVRKTPRL